MVSVRRLTLSLTLFVGLLNGVIGAGSEALVITPSTFDFGWCPDNAKISASFVIKNTGVDLIPITGFQPTCGCTASQFTPGSLASNEETKVGLTFNTRGYAGSSFDKPSKVKTEEGGTEYTVTVKGFVLDPKATVIPDHGGVAGFEKGSKEKKKNINIQNKGTKDVTLEVIQAPASWATASLDAKTIKAGASVPLEISVSGGTDETRDTSITIEASDGEAASRLTVAIRTGLPPPPVKRSTTAVTPPSVPPLKKEGK